MPQMHFYVPESVAKVLREKARAQGLSISRYVAKEVTKNIGTGWPEGYFESVVGKWPGKPLRRAPQGKHDKRETF